MKDSSSQINLEEIYVTALGKYRINDPRAQSWRIIVLFCPILGAEKERFPSCVFVEKAQTSSDYHSGLNKFRGEFHEAMLLLASLPVHIYLQGSGQVQTCKLFALVIMPFHYYALWLELHMQGDATLVQI